MDITIDRYWPAFKTYDTHYVDLPVSREYLKRYLGADVDAGKAKMIGFYFNDNKQVVLYKDRFDREVDRENTTVTDMLRRYGYPMHSEGLYGPAIVISADDYKNIDK